MDFNDLTQKYLTYCELQKGLNLKTIKAYRIDLRQFNCFANKYEEVSEKN